MEEELQRGVRPAASSSGSSAASISMCSRPRLFKRLAVAIEFSMLRLLLLTLHSAVSGSRVERADTHLRMSLCSWNASVGTDVVRI